MRGGKRGGRAGGTTARSITTGISTRSTTLKKYIPDKAASDGDTSDAAPDADIEQVPTKPSEHKDNTENITKTHQYGTRRTNELHPARIAGVAPRPKADIMKEAAQKRADREAAVQKRLEDVAEERRKMEDALRSLAAFEEDLAAKRALVEEEDEDLPTISEILEDRSSVDTRSFTESFHAGDGDSEPSNSIDESLEELDESAGVVAVGEKRKAKGDRVELSAKKVKQSKQAERQGIRETLSNERKKVQEEETQSTRLLKPSAPALVSSSQPRPGALRSDWRSHIHRQNTMSISPRTSSPAAVLPKPSQASRRTKTSTKHACKGSSELGGFKDADVSVSREGALKVSKAAARTSTKTTMVVAGEAELATQVEKKKRRAKGVVPDNQSLSFDSLPEWVKPLWRSTFIPTLVDVYGREEYPWDPEHSEPEERLIPILNELIEQIYNEEAYEEIDRHSKVFRIARQALSTWRAKFYRTALSIIRKDLEARGARHQVKQFVENALSIKSGAAFYAGYDEIEDHGVGACRSPYALRVFATHLSAIRGSVLSSTDKRRAEGALILAMAAVEHVFKMWKTGLFKQGPQFSEDNVLNKEWCGAAEGKTAKEQTNTPIE
ncbi:hypothetical protein DAEQUDRAFT_769913 [Daedalea quercina L-15889]|uniref:Uncharacterized protein n=1 Tax=Daedalea quercina L-15889 TaxID=1314783 RepID=A0A165LBT9_9APHY|nr:hypothetical protein DAEQUDRAFT_769913 [Daedalea quercina L-15889]